MGIYLADNGCSVIWLTGTGSDDEQVKRENKAPYIQNLGSGQLVVGKSIE
jgi:hypothetical protein